MSWIDLATIGLASLAVWPPALIGFLLNARANRSTRRYALRLEHEQMEAAADEQHRRYKHGDLRGLFGAHTPVDPTTGEPLNLRGVHDAMIDPEEVDTDCDWCRENVESWLGAEKLFYCEWLDAEDDWEERERERRHTEWRVELKNERRRAERHAERYNPFAYTIPHDENDFSGLSCRCDACVEHRKWLRDKQRKDAQRRDAMKVMEDIAKQLEIPLPMIGESLFTESAMLALKTGGVIPKHKTEAWNAYLDESRKPSTNCPECVKVFSHGDPRSNLRCTGNVGGNCRPS